MKFICYQDAQFRHTNGRQAALRAYRVPKTVIRLTSDRLNVSAIPAPSGDPPTAKHSPASVRHLV